MVELADSLDSGSSVHYGRAGSSPASRTKKERYPIGYRSFFRSRGVVKNPPLFGAPREAAASVGKGAAAERESFRTCPEAKDAQLAATQSRLAHQKETVERLFLFLYSGNMEHLLFSPHTFKRDILSDVSFFAFPGFR